MMGEWGGTDGQNAGFEVITDWKIFHLGVRGKVWNLGSGLGAIGRGGRTWGKECMGGCRVAWRVGSQ